MKRSIILLLVAMIAFSCIMVASADDEVTVLINGREADFDVPPMIISDRTMVPMRRVFELLGAKVEWVGEMQLAVATYKSTIIAMHIGEMSFTVTNVLTGETTTFELDVPAQIVNDRTLIPLRAVSEALGKTVSWDGNTRTATITG